MAPIVVKFEDKYSIPSNNKPTSTEKKLRKSGKPISLIELKRKKQEALEQELKINNKNSTNSAKDLKDDLELQRFISESHLLKNLSETREKANYQSGANLTLKTLNDPIIGKARVRTLDARIHELSSINGDEKKLNKMENIPMNIRKGMIKKQMERINQFETNARENGIILSKNKKGTFRKLDNDNSFISSEKTYGRGLNKDNKIRDRGLKIQSVGRSTRNGLVLSNDDIEKIQGSRGGRGGRAGRGGRGGRGGRR